MEESLRQLFMLTNEIVGVSNDVTFGYVWIRTEVYNIDAVVIYWVAHKKHPELSHGIMQQSNKNK